MKLPIHQQNSAENAISRGIQVFMGKSQDKLEQNCFWKLILFRHFLHLPGAKELTQEISCWAARWTKWTCECTICPHISTQANTMQPPLTFVTLNPHGRSTRQCTIWHPADILLVLMAVLAEGLQDPTPKRVYMALSENGWMSSLDNGFSTLKIDRQH